MSWRGRVVGGGVVVVATRCSSGGVPEKLAGSTLLEMSVENIHILVWWEGPRGLGDVTRIGE